MFVVCGVFVAVLFVCLGGVFAVFCVSLSCECGVSLSCVCGVSLSLLAAGRVSLVRNTALRVKDLAVDDQGWYECRILLLDTPTDELHNGTWTLLTVTGQLAEGLRAGGGA